MFVHSSGNEGGQVAQEAFNLLSAHVRFPACVDQWRQAAQLRDSLQATGGLFDMEKVVPVLATIPSFEMTCRIFAVSRVCFEKSEGPHSTIHIPHLCQLDTPLLK